MGNNDLGIYLHEQQNYSQNSSPFWLDWTMFNIHIHGPNTFLSVGSSEMNGEIFEYIVEYDKAIFDEILILLPKLLSAALKDKMENIIKSKAYPVVMDFEDDVSEMRPHLAVEVKLGDIKKLGDSKYIPFIIVSVMNPDSLNSFE